MQVLTRAHDQLFRRGEDERFDSLQELFDHCYDQKERSLDRWVAPEKILTRPGEDRLDIGLNGEGQFRLTDWSFSQLCRLARVSKDTVNRLSPSTASRVFDETLPSNGKPLQAYTIDDTIRSVHAASYTRLHHTELLSLVKEFATDFQPPQQASGGGSGLYCGEQDMFVFLIDPTGWAEINGEAFAPGFFLWNSEVGRRSVGIQSFWFQAVCQNHIVWDAVEVAEFSRKHTANVHEALSEIRSIMERLVARRDQRRDGFVDVIRKAMTAKLGDDADEVLKVLTRRGIGRNLARESLKLAEQQGGFTIFSVVDALTRIAGQIEYAGDRAEADERASSLLALVN